MAEHIPFITSQECCDIVNRIYPNSDVVRLQLDRAIKYLPMLKPEARRKVWLDPCIDAFDDIERSRTKPDKPKSHWFEFMEKNFPLFDKIGSPAYWAKPVRKEVCDFVSPLLDKCVADGSPAWITVPQIPFGDGTVRNKINRELAHATGEWKGRANFAGHLILPLIVTRKTQIAGKTLRNPLVKQAQRCYREAQAEGFWVVDSSLDEEKGSEDLRSTQFGTLIDFHEEINDVISSKIRIAGPYWGLNLVLWAKGLVDFPAIGIGTGYQYIVSGGTPYNAPKTRIALESLRRRVLATPQLKIWLEKAAADLGPAHPARAEFGKIRNQYSALSQPQRAHEQVARFYKSWFDIISSAPKAGRAMALFQDLSAAYAFGKSLHPIEDERASRRPESVAEPLMLRCL